MPPKKKGLTSLFSLRMHPEERALVETVQSVYGREGVEMGLNDVIRHLIRRAGIVPAHTVEQAREEIGEHAAGCPSCDADAETFGCPEGVYLYRNFRRLLRSQGDPRAVA